MLNREYENGFRSRGTGGNDPQGCTGRSQENTGCSQGKKLQHFWKTARVRADEAYRQALAESGGTGPGSV